jgi:hypothetical protein
MREKRWNTPKNGAYYPRIQSILGFFLSDFWEIKIKLFCVRRRENYVMKKSCVKWSVCEFLCLLALSTRVVPPYDRPPTSCRVFLIRTLPPPRHNWPTKKNIVCQSKLNKLSFTHTLIFVGQLYAGGGVVPERLVTYSTCSGRPPPPLPPPPPKEPEKVEK